MQPPCRGSSATKGRAIRSRSGARLDKVDLLRKQWTRELPDLDTSPMTVIGQRRSVRNAG